jgi:hypothetical protein
VTDGSAVTESMYYKLTSLFLKVFMPVMRVHVDEKACTSGDSLLGRNLVGVEAAMFGI